jgi:hypothetical protein
MAWKKSALKHSQNALNDRAAIAQELGFFPKFSAKSCLRDILFSEPALNKFLTIHQQDVYKQLAAIP